MTDHIRAALLPESLKLFCNHGRSSDLSRRLRPSHSAKGGSVAQVSIPIIKFPPASGRQNQSRQRRDQKPINWNLEFNRIYSSGYCCRLSRTFGSTAFPFQTYFNKNKCTIYAMTKINQFLFKEHSVETSFK